MTLIKNLLRLLCLVLIFPFTAYGISVKDLKKAHSQSSMARNEQRLLEQMELARRIQAETLNTSPEKFFNNYFQNMRKQLQQSSHGKQMLAVEADRVESAKKMTGNLFLDTTIRFVPESFTFFIAIGAVNYFSMLKNAGANPLMMEQHFESTKDPIGHLSFLMFMQTNAAYSSWQAKKLEGRAMTVQQRSFAMRAINYEGMAAGSFVSGLSADAMTLVKDCAALLTSSPKSEKELMASDEVCNQALIQWTLKKKSNQYIPTIAALVGVQAVTEFIDGGASTGASVLLKKLKADGTAKAFKTISIDVLFSVLPGKLALKSIKFIGHLTQIGFFVAVDHWLNATITRGFNNQYKNWDYTSFLNKNLRHDLDRQYEAGGLYGWNLNDIKNHKPIVPSRENLLKIQSDQAVPHISLNDFENKFLENLKLFGESQVDWRMHLNANLEQDLAGWMSETMKVVNQVHLAEDYYSRFLSELLSFAKTDYRTQQPETYPNHLPAKAWNNVTRFPYRKLPLFGVKFIPWEEGPGKLTKVTEADAYLLFPEETEKAQSAYLSQMATKLESHLNIENLNLNNAHKNLMINFLKQLKTAEPMSQGKALTDLAQLNIFSRDQSSILLINLRAAIFSEIGKINSQIQPGSGFSKAFEFNRQNMVKDANFADLNSVGGNSLYTLGSQMMFSMICGKNQGYVQKYAVPYLNVQYSSSNFIPPAITNVKIENKFCTEQITEENMFQKSILSRNSKGEVVQQTPLESIINNLNPEVFPDYRYINAKIDLSKWWTANALTPIANRLSEFDKGYQNVLIKLDENLFGKNSVDAVSQSESSILNGNMSDSYKFETNFYLNTLNLVKNKFKLNMPTNGKNSFLSEIQRISKLKKQETLPPIKDKALNLVSESLNELLKELKKPTHQIPEYYQSLSEEELQSKISSSKELSFLENNLNYSKYLDLKQKFDNSISEVEVLFGLSQKQGESYESLQIAELNFEQSVAKVSLQNLRQIEADIFRFVQMKILNKYGLKFSEQDGKAMMSQAAKKSCSRTATGCK